MPRVVYRLVAAPRAVPRDDAREPAAYLDVGLEEVVVVLEGFSTKVVSVVIKVISPSSIGRVGSDSASSLSSSSCLAFLNESGIGASGKSTQNAFIFNP